MTRDGGLVSVACFGLFPTSSIIRNQNNVGLNKGTISLFSNWNVTFDCWGRNDGENSEGEKNEGRGADHSWVPLHCPVQLPAQSDKAALLHFTAALCLIIWNEKILQFLLSIRKTYWERKEKLRNKIQTKIFADFTDWKSDHFLCSMWQFSES